jgi:hypothetical protein
MDEQHNAIEDAMLNRHEAKRFKDDVYLDCRFTDEL